MRVADGREQGASKPLAEVSEEPSRATTDEQLFRELLERFEVHAERSNRLAQTVYARAGSSPESDDALSQSLAITRTVFTPWSLGILAVTHLKGTASFATIREALSPISGEGLGQRLRRLEELGIVKRTVLGPEDEATRYSLTHKGQMLARIGEPVFLYLRLAHGWSRSFTEPGMDLGDDEAEWASIWKE